MTRYKCPACGGNQYSASPHKAQEACIYCGNKGTEIMKTLEPEVGEDAIKKLTKEQAHNILNTGFDTGKYKPIGRFYSKEGDLTGNKRGKGIKEGRSAGIKKDRMSIRIIDNEDKEFIIVVSEVER